jgi:RNA polymerase sigma factor (sigma-70 family)
VHNWEIARVVHAAAGGDEAAWAELVRRFARLVLSTARSFRLSPEEMEDVSQTTWLLLALHVRTLRDPEAVSGWLVTTAKRESLRLLRHRHREQPVDSDDLDVQDRASPGVDEEVLREELRGQVRRAFALLSDQCQRLLRMLMADPPRSYHDVRESLGMPLGSIGPVRARCLDRLRRLAGL